MKDYKQWIYNPDEEPVIINHSELEEYLSEGWFESPASFPKTIDRIRKSLDVQDDETIAQGEINGIGLAYTDICEIENFKLNVDTERSKKKIIEFLKFRSTHDDPIVIPEKVSIKTLREMVHSL